MMVDTCQHVVAPISVEQNQRFITILRRMIIIIRVADPGFVMLLDPDTKYSIKKNSSMIPEKIEFK